MSTPAAGGGAALRPRLPGWPWPVWWVSVAVVTGLAVGIAGPDLAVLSGYRSLGPLASVGQPSARTLALGAATVAVAGLLTAVVHAPGRPRGALSPIGYAALRTVRQACPVVAVAGLAIALLTISETVGVRPGVLLTNPTTLAMAVLAVEPAAGWTVAAIVAAIVGVLAAGVLTWRGASGLLGLLLAGLVVPSATSVASSERAHDWYGDALTLHVLAAVLWLGSTLAVVGLVRVGAADGTVLRRHDRIALACSIVLVLSGAIPAALDAGLAGMAGGYGLLVAVSAVLLTAGLVVIRRRRRIARAGQLLGVEVVLLTAATVAGTALTRMVPPAAEAAEFDPSDRLVFLLGYALPPRMGLVELLGWWRIDLIFAPAVLLAVVAYLLAVRRLHRAGARWPAGRTVAWCAGCLTVLVATSSGIGAFATAVFSMHQLAHALLSTVASLLLVLGHPLTLLRAAASPATAERISALADSGPLRALNRPPVAWCLAAAAVFGVYATGLFDAVVDTHWAHPGMDGLALAAGLVLFRAVLGARDPEPPAFVRLGLLFAVMMLHAAFAIWLLVQAEPLAARFYAAVALPFVPDLLADQRHGAVLAWVVSDLAMVGAATTVARRWLSTQLQPASRLGIEDRG